MSTPPPASPTDVHERMRAMRDKRKPDWKVRLAATMRAARPARESLEAAYRLAERQANLLNRAYAFNPGAWMSKEVKTRDEHDRERPVKPFPMHPYVQPMLDIFESEAISFIVKSRQMVNTWLTCAYALHQAQFFPHRLVLIISQKFEKSAALVDRIRFMYLNQPDWLRVLNPLDRQMRDQPIGTLSFAHGSRILALPEGEDQVRMHTASLIIADEADFWENFKKTYEACLPTVAGGGKLIALSTVRPGMFSKICGLVP